MGVEGSSSDRSTTFTLVSEAGPLMVNGFDIVGRVYKWRKKQRDNLAILQMQ
jgi:hypothetical protein